MGDDRTAFDCTAVEAWLDIAAPARWTQLTGGHSNFTYLVEAADGRSFVLRRPPLGELLPRAHDMAREWAILAALAPTDVPVPAPHRFCADIAVTGAPFYAMAHVEGRAMQTGADFDTHVAPAQRETLAASMVDTLAALHRVDPEGVGLGTLATQQGYLERQLRSWGRGWAASSTTTGLVDPRFEQLARRLAQSLPVPQRRGIVHGDFGFHNCLVSSAGEVAAIVDWEICSLGDPLADLGYLLVRWPGEAETAAAGAGSFADVADFPGIDWAAARYAAKTGLDLAALDTYRAFNFWKTAAIAHGVYARYLSGQKAAPAEGLGQFTDMIERSLAIGERLLDGSDAAR